MKEIILILVTISLLSCENKTIDPNETFILDQNTYFKKDSTLVTGKVKGWSDESERFIEEIIKDGKAEGVCKGWYQNGQLGNEKHFKDGLPEGLDKQWSENGKLKAKTIWEKDSNEGISEEYYDSGLLKSKGMSIHEIQEDNKSYKKTGVWEEFNEKGELKSKITYRFGIKIKTETVN
jgi:antitoxin component YwqK of YwqJK toxin-antitoxin module